MHDWIGLDIGGANLKAAHVNGLSRAVPFALWKEPQRLGIELRELLVPFPSSANLAVTMTGELCDCFASKREGVATILQAVGEAAQGRTVNVWTTRGSFVDLEQAGRCPLEVAAANWMALAHCAAAMAPSEPGLLIDVGSTTTDIIPFRDGMPIPGGLTDQDRLRTGELVYTGVRRTPLCALFGLSAAAEWFATTLDVALVLELALENPQDRDTADGRPATRAAAHGRLAHMLCGDGETCSAEETRLLAERALEIQVRHLANAVEKVARAMPELPRTVVMAGSGEFLARRVLARVILLSRPRILSLAESWGPALSEAACAYAVAKLAGVHSALAGEG